MKTCIQTFRAGTEELTAFLESTEHEAAFIGLLLERQHILEEQEKQLLTQLVATGTNRKRFVYTVAIVSLYGLFERFVDTLVDSFVTTLSRVVEAYEKMPEVIKKNHIVKSLDLAQAVIKDTHRSGITQETIIANLHSCLSGASIFA
jgi:hypothetical protein